MRKRLDERYDRSPVMSIRLPVAQITALKMVSREQHCTVSDIVRESVEVRLNEMGYQAIDVQIDGQMSVFDNE